MIDLKKYLSENEYPGRGVLIGMDKKGDHAVIAYFIMGRSVNSRNRVFVETEDGIKTEAFDPSKLSDPSLIIYHPVRKWCKYVVVTNGDQTDTVRNGLALGGTFESALRTRAYEPDEPNFTPRISGMITLKNNDFSYKLSILKKGINDDCVRYFYNYDVPQPGIGHLIHTYEGNGSPLPTFNGEPRIVEIDDDIDAFTNTLWNSLNGDNKVSLYVSYVALNKGANETRIINKNK